MRKYLTTFYMNIKDSNMYKMNFYLEFLSIPIQMIIIYFFWNKIIISSQYSIVSTNNIIIYFLFVQVLQIAYSSAMYTTYELWNEINNGTIIVWLLRPIYYPLYIFSKKISTFIINISVSLVLVCGTLLILNQKVSLFNILFGIISTILGYLILFEIQFIIGSLTFWLKKVLVLRDTIMSFLFLLGGVILPIDLTPDIIQKISYLTPIPYIYYLPAKIFSGPLGINYVLINILYQFIWIIIFSLIIHVIWLKGTQNSITQGA